MAKNQSAPPLTQLTTASSSGAAAATAATPTPGCLDMLKACFSSTAKVALTIGAAVAQAELAAHADQLSGGDAAAKQALLKAGTSAITGVSGALSKTIDTAKVASAKDTMTELAQALTTVGANAATTAIQVGTAKAQQELTSHIESIAKTPAEQALLQQMASSALAGTAHTLTTATENIAEHPTVQSLKATLSTAATSLAAVGAQTVQAAVPGAASLAQQELVDHISSITSDPTQAALLTHVAATLIATTGNAVSQGAASVAQNTDLATVKTALSGMAQALGAGVQQAASAAAPAAVAIATAKLDALVVSNVNDSVAASAITVALDTAMTTAMAPLTDGAAPAASAHPLSDVLGTSDVGPAPSLAEHGAAAPAVTSALLGGDNATHTVDAVAPLHG